MLKKNCLPQETLRKNEAFTVLELLIVIVILGVLVGLAIPGYEAVVERSRTQEAITVMSQVRNSLIRHYAVYNDYTFATFNLNASPPSATLDYVPPTSAGIQPDGNETAYIYSLSGLGPAQFVIHANRVAMSGRGEFLIPSACHITLDQRGVITKTGAC